MRMLLGWLLVLGACNRPLASGHSSDGDGGSNPVTLTITVRVTRAGEAVPAATVVFHGSAGDVIATRTTDASGLATSEVPQDGMVTVIDPAAANSLSTVTHLRASASPIELPLDGERAAQPTAGTLRVEAPPTAAPAGSDHFVIETPCATFPAQTLPATFDLPVDCFAGTRMPVVVTAWTPDLSLEEPGQALAFVGGFATGATDVALVPGPWSQACKQVNASVADNMNLRFFPRLGGVPFHTPGDFCPSVAPAPGFTYALPVPDLGEGALATSFGYVEGSVRYATLDASYPSIPDSVDVGRANPLLSGAAQLVAMDGTGADWTADTSLADADVVLATLTWGLGGSRYVTWRFVVPGTATKIAVPSLPAEVALSLANPSERIAELRFLDASWVSHPDDIAPLAILESDQATLPESASLRGYTQRIFHCPTRIERASATARRPPTPK